MGVIQFSIVNWAGRMTATSCKEEGIHDRRESASATSARRGARGGGAACVMDGWMMRRTHASRRNRVYVH